jgi:Polyketide cyclase / dehydrase and lipid transport/Fasciclin domain
MARIDGEIVINRPVEEVFDFAADERNEPRYNPRMLSSEQLSPGPVGLGSRFRAVMGSWPRRTTMTTEFTGYDRPRRLASTTRLATMDIQGALTFDPVPGGTRMRWSWDMASRGLLKLLSPLVVRVGVKKADLVDTLNGAQGITVFAPTNDAFGALPKPTLDKALGDPKGC